MVDRVGQQLGNYRLIRLLGHGGFAEVYLGEHVYLKTPAAIKVLQTRLGSESDLEAFLDEARMIAHLTHPNIVRVLDFGVHEETPFLVMDYAVNGTLRQRHNRKAQLPVTTVLPYVKQIAAALQHAHDEKLIHRDVKPENMLLGKRGDVLLSDFGIALVAQSSRYQGTQDVVGTVAYMSPDQIQGKPRPASDQYSLAVVVYEWLSGDRPFHGSFTELCAQHMFAEPVSLLEKVPAINPAVAQVVSIALAKKPKERFGTVSAFANALEQAAGNTPTPRPVATPTPTPPTRLSPPSLPPPAPPVSRSTTPTPPLRSRNPSMLPLPTPSSRPSRSTRSKPTYPSHTLRQQYYPSYQPMPFVAPREQGRVGWRIGKLEWIVMAVSLIVVVIGAVLVGKNVQNLQINTSDPTSIFLWTALCETIPLFLAAAFGPWVGLFLMVDAFIGGFAFTSAYNSTYGYPFSFTIFLSALPQWEPYLMGVGIVGFIVGLSAIASGGRYKSLGSLFFADVLTIISMLIASLLIFTLVPLSASLTSGHVISQVPISLPDLQVLTISVPGLIVLPIVLLIYSLIAFPKR